jgi:histidine triad (HIT) family protein
MFNHSPLDYVCPICLGVQGVENSDTLIRHDDIVYKDDKVMVFIASYFIGKNAGHLIVVPTEHFENIFDLPDDVGAHLFLIAKKMSIAMMNAYNCEGITTLQNNGPAAGQHAFHYHLHLFPRYVEDDIYAHMNSKRQTTPEERKPFAEKMSNILSKEK